MLSSLSERHLYMQIRETLGSVYSDETLAALIF